MNKTTYEDYLLDHGTLTYRFVGTSMNPLLKQDRDLVTVTRKTDRRCHRGDVVLYKRPADGAYVLHRVVEVRPDSYVILGDNCVRREYGITDRDILGVMTSFLRDGKQVSVDHPVYRLYVAVWLALEPLRPGYHLAVASARHGKAVVAGEEPLTEVAGKAVRRLRKAVLRRETTAERAEQKAAADRELLATGDYLVELLNATLHKTTPPGKPDGVSWNGLYRLAKRHIVDNMVFEAIRGAADQELVQVWQHRRDANVAKNMVQLAERERILAALTDAGLDVLPLKGSVLIDLYPDPTYRQMADLDLLIRKEQQADVKSVMEDLGYTTKLYGAGKDDIYELPPFLHVEMHHDLIPESTAQTTLRAYYEDPWRRAVPDSDDKGAPIPHRYHFSLEDYYLFQLAHFWRHFQVGGSGIRNVMDIAVFLEHYESALDREYLAQELKKLELTEFCENMVHRARAWFGECASAADRNAERHLDRSTDRNTDRLLYTSGAYGLQTFHQDYTMNRYAERYRNGALAQIAYLKDALFPNYDYMVLALPDLKVHQSLLPVYWGIRAVRRMKADPGRLGRILDATTRFRHHEGRQQRL